MTKQTISAVILAMAMALGIAAPVRADIIDISPTFDTTTNTTASPDTTDFESSFDDGDTASPFSVAIGNFLFTIPIGEIILGGTISGTFGDANNYSTTPTDLFVNGGTIQVAGCDDPTALCATNQDPNALVPWSYSFTAADLTALGTELAAGSIDFSAVQNEPFGQVVVGTPELDLQVSPEPASIFTLVGGLLAFATLRRRK